MTALGLNDILRADPLARVEGEGAMRVTIRDGVVSDVALNIYEPPRFFESLLRGRAWTEPPDITARICGICPVAYQMSACLAIEDACGVTVPPEIQALRRLLYCGEWIESHALHIYLLHAPDFLGYQGGLEMARDHPGRVDTGLRLKKTGNDVMTVVGGRSVHPVNVAVGGFHRLPEIDDVRRLLPDLERARDDALATVEWVATFAFPDFEQPQEYLSLRADAGYPLDGGTFVTTGGAAFPASCFPDVVTEQHVARSNALHARMDGEPYVVGPLARFALNRDRLSPAAAEAADAAGLGPECRNPFRSIVVRAVELVYACDEAIRLAQGYDGAPMAAASVEPRAGVGHGATEAPRGVLYHRYELSANGAIQAAQIVPPTSQNLAAIEQDLRRFAQDRLDLDTEELTRRCEQAVRNYDPCISCATHAFDVVVDRR